MSDEGVHLVERERATIEEVFSFRNDFFSFMVNRPYHMQIYVSDEIDRDLVQSLCEGTSIVYSAEEDDEGDMVATHIEVLNGKVV